MPPHWVQGMLCAEARGEMVAMNAKRTADFIVLNRGFEVLGEMN